MTRKLYIIPGHGAGDPGACAGGESEADLVRQLAARMKAWGGSKVVRAPYKRNFYADYGISKMIRSTKRWRILELHMDSDDTGTAKGGHAIIGEGCEAGPVVKATAAAIAKHFPGRAETIKERGELRNPRLAKAKGYYYILLECGFISNKSDRAYFIVHMDDIAKDLLRAHGIEPRKTPKKVKCPW